MKENFTSINVVLDASGSMWNIASDTIGGFNQFLSEQKDVEGEAVVTLCTFNTTSHIVHDCVPLTEFPNLDEKTYVPGGGTALWDAIGSTIDSVGEKLQAIPEDERPSKVIMLVITDGYENSSRDYVLAQIQQMITHKKDVYNWDFVFMGANIDAMKEGETLGISGNNTMNYDATSIGTRSLYSDVSKSMKRYRTVAAPNESFFDSGDEEDDE